MRQTSVAFWKYKNLNYVVPQKETIKSCIYIFLIYLYLYYKARVSRNNYLDIISQIYITCFNSEAHIYNVIYKSKHIIKQLKVSKVNMLFNERLRP